MAFIVNLAVPQMLPAALIRALGRNRYGRKVIMADEAKRWWEMHGRSYQETCRIPIDVLYGTGSPNEESLQLIGPVAGKRVLEVGCGGAQASIAFAKQGAVVTAVDVASSEIEFARELAKEHHVSVKFHQRDMADLSPVASACIFRSETEPFSVRKVSHFSPNNQ